MQSGKGRPAAEPLDGFAALAMTAMSFDEVEARLTKLHADIDCARRSSDLKSGFIPRHWPIWRISTVWFMREPESGIAEGFVRRMRATRYRV
jgi:hypothetical protein